MALIQEIGIGRVSSGNSVTITVTTAVTAGNSIIVTALLGPGVSGVSCGDNRGNTYTTDISAVTIPTDGQTLYLFRVFNVIGLSIGSLIQITWSGASTYAEADATEHSTLFALDKTSTGTGSLSTTPTSGTTATTTTTNQLVIGAVGVGNTGSIVPTPGTTNGTALIALTPSGDLFNASLLQPMYAYIATTGAESINGTTSGNVDYAACVATYIQQVNASAFAGTIAITETLNSPSAGESANATPGSIALTETPNAATTTTGNSALPGSIGLTGTLFAPSDTVTLPAGTIPVTFAPNVALAYGHAVNASPLVPAIQGGITYSGNEINDAIRAPGPISINFSGQLGNPTAQIGTGSAIMTALASNVWSVSAWVYRLVANWGAGSPILWSSGGGSSRVQCYATGSAGGLGITEANVGGPYATITVPQGAWTHVCFTYDNITVRGYLNGVDTADTAHVWSTTAPASSVIIGGFGGGSSSIPALVRQLHFYSTTLSSGDVTNDMNGVDPTTIGTCVGAFPIDGGSGWTLKDRSASHQDFLFGSGGTPWTDTAEWPSWNLNATQGDGLAPPRNCYGGDDPGFESGVDGWLTFNGATITQDTAHPFSGTYSLKIATPGSVANEGGSDNNGFYAQPHPVENGKTYQAKFYLWSTVGTILRIRIQNNQTYTYNGGNYTTKGGWETITWVFTATQTEPLNFIVTTGIGIGAQATSFWIDNISLVSVGGFVTVPTPAIAQDPNGNQGIWRATTPNYVTGFESGIGSWVGHNSTETLTKDNGPSRFGLYALKVVTPGSGANEGAMLPTGTFTVTGGSVYSLGIWLYSNAGGVAMILNAVTNGSTSGSPAPLAFTSAKGWQWIELQGFAANSTGTVSAHIDVVTNGTSATTFWIDGVQWEPGSIATPFIGDGNSTRAAARMQVPVNNAFTATAGWIAVLFGVQTASSAFVSTPAGIFEWYNNGSNRILGYYQNGQFFTYRQGSGNSSQINPAASFSSGSVWIIFAWDSGHIYCAVNGGGLNIATQANNIPTGMPSQFDIGNLPQNSGNIQCDQNIQAFITGSGLPTNSDSAFIATFGAAPPTWRELLTGLSSGSQPTMLWPHNALPAIDAPNQATDTVTVPTGNIPLTLTSNAPLTQISVFPGSNHLGFTQYESQPVRIEQIVGTISTIPTYGFTVTDPLDRYSNVHPDRSHGQHQLVLSGSDNRVRIHNVTRLSDGATQNYQDVAFKISIVDANGNSVLVSTLMTNDAAVALGNDWYYDVPAASVVSGGGPWIVTLTALDATLSATIGTFVIKWIENGPFFVTSMRSGTICHYQIDNLVDGNGTQQTASTCTGSIAVSTKSGSVLLGSTTMSQLNGQLTYDTLYSILTSGTDPWNTTITLKDLSSVVHLTLKLTGTDSNRV